MNVSIPKMLWCNDDDGKYGIVGTQVESIGSRCSLGEMNALICVHRKYPEISMV